MEEINVERELKNFVYEIMTTSRILWRYFNDMFKSSNKANRYNVASIEIGQSSEYYREGEKQTILGKLVDGYYIEDEDLVAIEKMLFDINKRATHLNEY